MSYGDYIEDFWANADTLGLDAGQTAFWFALFTIFGRADFPDRLPVDNATLCGMLGADERSVRRWRDGLADKGVIGCERGAGRKPPTYIIDRTKIQPRDPKPDVGKSVNKGVEDWAKPQPKEEKPKPKPKPKPKARRVPKTEQDGQILIPFKEEKRPKMVRQEPPPPTIEEVVRLFAMNGRTEDEAKEFFYYYDAQGWHTSAGQKIQNLDSMVNRWLTNGKRKLTQTKPQYGGGDTELDKRRERNIQAAQYIISSLDED